MDEDRKFRFLVAPLLLLFFVGWGMWLDSGWHQTIVGLFAGKDAKEILGHTITTLMGGGVMVFTLGVLIGTTSYVILMGAVRLRNWSDQGIKTHEVYVSDDTLSAIFQKLGAPEIFARSVDFYAAMSFDHGILSNSNPGVHRWMVRRWSAFTIDVTSITALAFAGMIVCGASIHVRCFWQWMVPWALALVVFTFAACWAWQDTMGMLVFQASLPTLAPSEKKGS